MDLTKLSPAPWHWDRAHAYLALLNGDSDILWYTNDDDGIHAKPDDAEFIALARNAFDVMMRRQWSPTTVWDRRVEKMRWCVEHNDDLLEGQCFVRDGEMLMEDDPFTALVEADKWYKENVEKAKT